ncbi:L-type lectin-domain containing receptor kinase IV.1 [Acorus calamus]|uniref:non-specific serine/threonine protein kinase n=1 Tax=Acorus calamus TaxID=4465 RepID=A0AAV9EYF8_ACOCL|nr:L-type lectin-domain containing receptor kinase IV.1 [Acorus calamus]
MAAMVLKLLFCTLLMIKTVAQTTSFIFNGFHGANLSLNNAASITSGGLLRLTDTGKQETGHAFFPNPIIFDRPPSRSISSFATKFVFAIVPEYPLLGGAGFAFAISPSKALPNAMQNQYLGLLNTTTEDKPSNHIFAVEFDTILTQEFNDIDDNHVGIDINSLRSNESHTAGYYNASSTNGFTNLSLISGELMQAWIDYDGLKKQINVTLAPTTVPKPERPLLSSIIDLSNIISGETMYAGFSAATGPMASYHYILGWSLALNGEAQDIDLSRLPAIPRNSPKKTPIALLIGISVSAFIALVSIVAIIVVVIRRRLKYAELLEDWELEYGPTRYSYRDLFKATKGFRESELLGAGGFGRVYRGVLPASETVIAVKRVSHESRQGMREFVSEIASIGRLRHRHLVQLLGYCRRKRELLLVYECMPNGSLDRHLFDVSRPSLDWEQRLRIVKGVASALLYLHEEWEQVVIHRDVKASNVLLDERMEGRLGDFGLARLYDHGTDPQTTHVVGTLGYLAPELARTGKAAKATDVYAFGAFVLEVACGVRSSAMEEFSLVDWVIEHWRRGVISEAGDPRLGGEYCVGEMEVVLKIGLMCSHGSATARPGMRQVVRFLDGDAALPDISPDYMEVGVSLWDGFEGFDHLFFTYDASSLSLLSEPSVTESVLSGGR